MVRGSEEKWEEHRGQKGSRAAFQGCGIAMDFLNLEKYSSAAFLCLCEIYCFLKMLQNPFFQGK
jgi:hypothetical protein